jgi:hypothetical protein
LGKTKNLEDFGSKSVKAPRGRPRHECEKMLTVSSVKRWEVVDGVNVAQDRKKWSAVVNTAMNFELHEIRGVYCL